MRFREGEFGEDTRWGLAASDGFGEVTCLQKRWWTDPFGDAAILAELSLTGQFLERDRFERRQPAPDWIEDFRLDLPQVILSRPGLESLLAELRLWFDEPRDISVDLSAVHQVSLQVTLGQDPRLICKIDRPVCSVRYSTGTSVTFECLLVVDQSCLRLLRDDLARALRDFHE
jgi:hypothetical protein